MKIEKEKKVFQLFFKSIGGKSEYDIVFATSKARAVEGIARIITRIKELKV